MALVFLVLIGSLILFILEWLPVDVTALLGLSVLVLGEVITPAQGLAGFANPAVITVGAMFVLSEGLSRTGAVSWLTRMLAGAGSESGRSWLVIALVIVLVTSGFINNTAIVVLFIPVMLGLARRKRISPSKLLIPVSYVSILGGTCTLIGTSTNILISSEAQRYGQQPFSMFEFSQVGMIVALVGFVYVLWIAPRLLPERATMMAMTDSGLRQYVTEVEVLPESSWVGKPLDQTTLGRMKDLQVLEIIRDETILAPKPDLILEPGDLALLQGDANALFNVDQSGQVNVLPALASESGRIGTSVDISLTEIVITPNSRFIGETVREAGFRRRYGVSVFAIQRGGRHLRRSIGEVELRIGDALLLQGSQKAFDNLKNAESFLVVKGTDAQLTRTRRSPLAIIIMAAVIASVTLNLMPVEGAAFIGAVLMVLTRCVSAREAYGAIDISVLMLIIGTLALGKAMDTSGAAKFLVEHLMGVVQALGPHGVLWSLFALTAVLTSVMSNNATAVLLTPLSVQLAVSLGVDPRPMLLGVLFGSSAAYATPVGYQTNTLIFGPGGYFFRDYMRVGLPLTIIVGVISCLLIPVFFPF